MNQQLSFTFSLESRMFVMQKRGAAFKWAFFSLSKTNKFMHFPIRDQFRYRNLGNIGGDKNTKW